MSVRTRFAPSPTGYLHIGGVRTALFNWLFARKHGGQFILRIDDTDATRNVDAALQPILDGFRWLGLDWDEGPEVGGPYAPYYQSQRADKYQQAVDALLASGAAYRDYATSQEVQTEREAAEREKRDFVYSRRWMAEDEAQAEEFAADGRTAVVRLKMPREGSCEFHDLVRGDMTFEWSREQDHVIQRADGTCLYHLASVVDDHDFQITHVVRAVEHLSNTPRQVFIARSLGFELPQYAHIPFIAEPGSQNKISKRKIEKYLKNREFEQIYDMGSRVAERIGIDCTPESFNPVLTSFYQNTGFLPDAVINYLLLLGWSLDGESEHFSRDQMISLFSLDRIVKSPASFDPQKLLAFEQRHMNDLPVEQRVDQVMPFLRAANLENVVDGQETREYVAKIVAAAGDRIRIGGDILGFDDFFLPDDELVYDEKAFQKRLIKPENAGHLLSEFKKRLVAVPEFTAEQLDRELHQFVEEMDIAVNQIIHALRVAITGKSAGFGMFETMEILGSERTLSRIDLSLERMAQGSST